MGAQLKATRGTNVGQEYENMENPEALHLSSEDGSLQRDECSSENQVTTHYGLEAYEITGLYRHGGTAELTAQAAVHNQYPR